MKELATQFLTKSGWIFTLTSLQNPNGFLWAIPVYCPDPLGERVIHGQHYRKCQQKNIEVYNSNNKIKSPYESDEQVNNQVGILVPVQEIIEWYDNFSTFQSWLKTDDVRIEIVLELLNRANVPLTSVGLGGSWALGAEKPDSDVDITIYGSKLTDNLLRELERALFHNEIQSIPIERAQRYADYYTQRFGSARPEHFLSDICKFYYKNQDVSFILCYHSDEKHLIEHTIYEQVAIGDLQVDGTVLSNTSGWLFPRHFLVRDDNGKIYKVWSHLWYHKAIAFPGHKVSVFASLFDDNTMLMSQPKHFIRILP